MIFCDVTLYFYATREVYIQSPVSTYSLSLKKKVNCNSILKSYNYVTNIDYVQQKC